MRNIKTWEPESFVHGKAAYGLRNYNKADEFFLVALQDNSNYTPSYYYLAKTKLFLNQCHQAIYSFRKFLQLHSGIEPRSLSDVYDSIGMAYQNVGNISEAKFYFKKAIDADNSFISPYHNLGVLALQLGELQGTYKYLMQAYKLNKQHPQILYSLGSYYEVQDNYEGAITYYLEAKSCCPADDTVTLTAIHQNLAEAYAQRGHELYQSNDYEAAKIMYEETIKYSQNHIVAISQLGMVFYKQFSYREARSIFNIIISKTEGQDCSDAWVNRACALREQGLFRLAKGAISMAKKISPEYTDIPDEETDLATDIVSSACYLFAKRREYGLLVSDPTRLFRPSF